MLTIMLGMGYIGLLMAASYILWKREDNRVRKEINQALEDLREQHPNA